MSGEGYTVTSTSVKLSGFGNRSAEFPGLFTAPVNKRNSLLGNDKQNLNQKPNSLPIASAPKNSSQSNQGGINGAILMMAYFSPFCRRMVDPWDQSEGNDWAVAVDCLPE